jgi:DNA-binding Xre family transcriptional regulator
MGISPATLHRLEIPGQNVTLKTWKRIVDRFHCRISEQFREK